MRLKWSCCACLPYHHDGTIASCRRPINLFHTEVLHTASCTTIKMAQLIGWRSMDVSMLRSHTRDWLFIIIIRSAVEWQHQRLACPSFACSQVYILLWCVTCGSVSVDTAVKITCKNDESILSLMFLWQPFRWRMTIACPSCHSLPVPLTLALPSVCARIIFVRRWC